MNDFINARRKQRRARIGAARFGKKAIARGARPRRKIARSMLPPARLPEISLGVRGLDPITRVSKIRFARVFPHRYDDLCRCGCGQAIGTVQWATEDCHKGALFAYWYWKGDPTAIEWALWRRDKGVCAACRTEVPGGRRGAWHGHHVVQVAHGGGRLGLTNFQTLCIPCHKAVHGRHSNEKIT